jgi:cholesterol transport system auxiliary component
VRLTLRAHIVDNATRRVLAWREFDETADAAGENPYGGVMAANRAAQTVLQQLARMAAEAAKGWQPPAAEIAKRAEGSLPGK